MISSAPGWRAVAALHRLAGPRTAAFARKRNIRVPRNFHGSPQFRGQIPRARRTMDQAQRELTEFVIKRAFEPVMHAKTDGRSEADRRALEHVQKATRSEIERYRRYGSARELATNFRRDLSSDA